MHALEVCRNIPVTDPALLTKAVLRAAEHLQLQEALPDILGLAEASGQQLIEGARLLDPSAEEWQQALRFTGLFRSLLRLTGSATHAREWLRVPHHALREPPAALLRTAAGRDRVYRYLDAVEKYEIKLPPKPPLS